MLTQNYLKMQLAKLSNMKSLLGRSRLRFTLDDGAFYLYMLAEHQHRRIEFKQLYLEYKYRHGYANFMKNIQLFSRLMPVLFQYMNRDLNITQSPFLNIIDSTLIQTVESQNITQKHWKKNTVTIRSTKSNTHTGASKRYICGFKVFVHLNRKGRVYRAHVSPINIPDNEITKNPCFYQLHGVLLGDRGFNSKEIRKRSSGLYRLISPPHKKEKHVLTPQEQRLYKLRWQIETMYQRLKNEYKEFKLKISNRYSKSIQHGEVFLALIKYNMS